MPRGTRSNTTSIDLAVGGTIASIRSGVRTPALATTGQRRTRPPQTSLSHKKKEAGPSACLRSTHRRHHASAGHCAQLNHLFLSLHRLLRPSGLSIKAQLKFCVAMSRKLKRPLSPFDVSSQEGERHAGPSPAPSSSLDFSLFVSLPRSLC